MDYDVRQHMIDYRNNNGLSIEEMSCVCKCTPMLLEKIEFFNGVTHPNIAARIAHTYKLNVEDYNSIIPVKYRSDFIPEVKPKPTYDDYLRFMDKWR